MQSLSFQSFFLEKKRKVGRLPPEYGCLRCEKSDSPLEERNASLVDPREIAEDRWSWRHDVRDSYTQLRHCHATKVNFKRTRLWCSISRTLSNSRPIRDLRLLNIFVQSFDTPRKFKGSGRA
jgi:hypothetical protein